MSPICPDLWTSLELFHKLTREVPPPLDKRDRVSNSSRIYLACFSDWTDSHGIVAQTGMHRSEIYRVVNQWSAYFESKRRERKEGESGPRKADFYRARPDKFVERCIKERPLLASNDVWKKKLTDFINDEFRGMVKENLNEDVINKVPDFDFLWRLLRSEAIFKLLWDGIDQTIRDVFLPGLAPRLAVTQKEAFEAWKLIKWGLLETVGPNHQTRTQLEHMPIAEEKFLRYIALGRTEPLTPDDVAKLQTPERTLNPGESLLYKVFFIIDLIQNNEPMRNLVSSSLKKLFAEKMK